MTPPPSAEVKQIRGDVQALKSMLLEKDSDAQRGSAAALKDVQQQLESLHKNILEQPKVDEAAEKKEKELAEAKIELAKYEAKQAEGLVIAAKEKELQDAKVALARLEAEKEVDAVRKKEYNLVKDDLLLAKVRGSHFTF